MFEFNAEIAESSVRRSKIELGKQRLTLADIEDFENVEKHNGGSKSFLKLTWEKNENYYSISQNLYYHTEGCNAIAQATINQLGSYKRGWKGNLGALIGSSYDVEVKLGKGDPKTGKQYLEVAYIYDADTKDTQPTLPDRSSNGLPPKKVKFDEGTF